MIFFPLLPWQGKPEEGEGSAAVFWSTFVSCCGCMGVEEGRGGDVRGGGGEEGRKKNCGSSSSPAL